MTAAEHRQRLKGMTFEETLAELDRAEAAATRAQFALFAIMLRALIEIGQKVGISDATLHDTTTAYNKLVEAAKGDE